MAEPDVRARIDAKPTERMYRAMEARAEVLQNRYERWTRWHYSRILSGIRGDLSAMDHIPDDAEVQRIVQAYSSQQEDALRRLYLNIYPEAVDFVMTDEQKRCHGMIETKDDGISLEQQRLLAWIQANLGISIAFINRTTIEMVETIRRSSTSTEDFLRRLQSSQAFSPYRARMIAVTQTNQAVNSAISSVASTAADGRRMVKTWRTSGRTNVRDTHRVMNGVTIDEGELYEVPRLDGGTDYMSYPSDSSHGASPANIINCHCKSFPRLAEYERCDLSL